MSSQQPLYLRSLRRALELSDGPEQLAAELRLSVEYLKLLLNGAMQIPEQAFFRVADLLIDRALAELTEPGHPKASTSVPSTKRAGEPPFRFKWLAVDKFKRLTAEQKDSYLVELTRQLGVPQPQA